MWSRKELKERAKKFLKQSYWSALGISIVIALAAGDNIFGSRVSSDFRNQGGHFLNFNINNYDFNFDLVNWTIISIIIAISLITFLIIISLRVLVGYPLEVGGRRWFTRSAQYKENSKCFNFGFDRQNYKGIVKTMFVKDIYIFLWSLLLIIPGIIKYYAYRMVPYILAENPNIGVTKAIELSNEMTKGHKFDMFVLDLSFIGWYLLGSLAFGIGVIFVNPYVNATGAELYLVLRKNALENNLCSYEDLLLENEASDENNIW